MKGGIRHKHERRQTVKDEVVSGVNWQCNTQWKVEGRSVMTWNSAYEGGTEFL